MRVMPGTQAPELALPLAGGGSWSLAEDAPEVLTMIVVYRGYHCPICKGYLGKLVGLLDRFEADGASVIAVSMDPQDRAEAAKADWGLERLRIGYGMSEAVARSWGLYLSSAIRDGELALFPEPGLFWVKPDGTLYLVDVGSMPFARPDLELLAARVQRAREYPPRGTA
ncbi:redoxin domain-containing protein [Pseudoruegeria sp. HB172150]|uniref:redoxin domain-containing protein n=1 Tax=Pseudoruegeria sp. HB172150 TaxID=2721164 RepID=UPI001557B4A8|nr:redoxin domain-containing protein [Pseudoruegeria sp. HB172150]